MDLDTDVMTRVRLTGAGGPQVLHVECGPVPVPGDGKVVVVRMHAAGIAFGDVTIRQGRNPRVADVGLKP